MLSLAIEQKCEYLAMLLITKDVAFTVCIILLFVVSSPKGTSTTSGHSTAM